MFKITSLFINPMDSYQINEIVSCTHRDRAGAHFVELLTKE